MVLGDRRGDTICAVSSPHGVGGVSLIRMSGPRALSILNNSLLKKISRPESHRIYLDYFLDHEQEKVDQVLVSYFAEGKSFTGEEVVEISCHGSPLICQEILRRLCELGARPADRGEFSFRSFMNGKIDLTQAEGILDLIQSQSTSAQKLALRQLEGKFSKEISAVEDAVLWSLANIEASIDFSTEGLDLNNADEISARLKLALNTIAGLLKQYRTGKILRDGFRVSIVGKPNVGKSSLLNTLVQRDRAIVSDIAGTTRDIIETDLIFDGIKFTFVDTAGIRFEATDHVEKIGISRALEELAKSDAVVFVWDRSLGVATEDVEILSTLNRSRILFVGNKYDLVNEPILTPSESEVLGDFVSSDLKNVCLVSAIEMQSREKILNHLKNFIGEAGFENSALLANGRHYSLLVSAESKIHRAIQETVDGESLEFVAVTLKEALLSLQEIHGKHYDDQILDRVFKEFCIGK